MSQIGLPGIILIVLIALLLFGPKKLPELGRAFGRTLREFKQGTRELLKDDDDNDEKPAANSASRNVIDAEAVADPKKEDKRLPE